MVRKGDPTFDPRPTPQADAIAKTRALQKIRAEDGTLTRPLTTEEERWIMNELVLSKTSFEYWATRYTRIKTKDAESAQLYPLFESQTIIINKIGKIEEQCNAGERLDGILVAILKARQLGASTLAEAMLAHRAFLYGNTTSLIAADVPAQSIYLFNMLERIYDNLPWWMQPVQKYREKGTSLYFDRTDSLVLVESGKSVRGGSDITQERGQMARGKLQPLSEPILTPKGWVLMGALSVGDVITGSDGEPTHVMGVYPQGHQDTFRVTFTDEAWTECADKHLWYVQSPWQRWRGTPGKVLPMKALGMLQKKTIRKYFIPMVGPVTFATCPPLPLNPYALGLLLGDGCLSQNQITFTSADAELVLALQASLPSGHCVQRYTRYGYGVCKGKAKKGVSNIIHGVGLRGTKSATKFIPEPYRRASVEDRVALLQGLMDTDGYCDKNGRCQYTTVSKQLAEDVQELVELLGGTARISSKIPSYSYKGEARIGQRAYTLAVRPPEWLVPFRLARKVARFTRKRKYFPSRAIRSIEPAGKREMQCISVAAKDGLYVTRHGIVTHNTVNLAHLSEISTWENPEQIDDSLLPAIPRTSRTLAIWESTARGRGNTWHDIWKLAKTGIGRLLPIFIPWYAAGGLASVAPNER